MAIKTCTKCNLGKELSGFHKQKTGKDGHQSICKECSKERRRIYREANKEREAERWKVYSEANREKLAEYEKAYREANKEKLTDRKKRWYEANKEKVAEYNKTYREANKEKVAELIRANRKQRYKEDPIYRLKKNISSKVRVAITKNKGGHPVLEFLPYTLEELKEHLQLHFTSKMNWENHGSYWHVDHVYPHSKFKYETMDCEAFKLCWSLNNLRPLEASENIRKSNNITTPWEEIFDCPRPTNVE